MIHQVHLVAYLVADQVPNSTFLLHTRGLLVLDSRKVFTWYLFCEFIPNYRAVVYSLLVIFGGCS